MLDAADARPYHHGRLRVALLAAAERRLRTEGADRLSLRDLARDIGVSHAAPRRHFSDRQALLDALAADGFARLGGALQAALSRSDAEFATRVRHAVIAYVNFATQDAALHELMNSGKHRPGAELVAEAAKAAFEPMIELIEDGQRLGLLESGPPERIGIILFATVLGIATMINGGMVSSDVIDGYLEAAVNQFLRGAHPAVA